MVMVMVMVIGDGDGDGDYCRRTSSSWRTGSFLNSASLSASLTLSLVMPSLFFLCSSHHHQHHHNVEFHKDYQIMIILRRPIHNQRSGESRKSAESPGLRLWAGEPDNDTMMTNTWISLMMVTKKSSARWRRRRKD